MAFWKEKPDRKPLILRGARQVGKTSLVELFSKTFRQYILLNLEKPEDRKIFENDLPFHEQVEAMFFLKDKQRLVSPTLLFIDEIQYSAQAVKNLRYFYEEMPELFVIAAGSLLETLLEKKISFPVGRVEYLAIRPCNFPEFLLATGEKKSLEMMGKNPVPEYVHQKLSSLFNRFTLIGGMPGIISSYLANPDLITLHSVYESILVSYFDDIEKYARNSTMEHILRHVIRSVFSQCGSRVTFERFGNSNYRSREIGEAFRLLEKAMLLQLVYPVENIVLPYIPNLKKSPRLHLLDTGLVNYMAKIQKEILQAGDIADVYRGKVVEHIIGQELMAKETSVLAKLAFWTRESKNSQAEVDYLYLFKDLVIPVEVKSGSAGKLRSLHLFIDQSPHRFAVRFWSGKMQVENVKTLNQKEYTLISLPHYMACKLDDILSMVI
ncbi:MAG: AAA family ATPase [Bacteroidetes bacterium]|nr:AAA family ATPase [Bacteroidota bacterium]